MSTILTQIGDFTLSQKGFLFQVENPDGSIVNFSFRANGELYMIYNNHKLNYFNNVR